MAAIVLDRQEAEHRRSAWFVAHLMLTLGQWKRHPNFAKIMNLLNSPIDSRTLAVPITSKEDLIALGKEHGLDLVPDGCY